MPRWRSPELLFGSALLLAACSDSSECVGEPQTIADHLRCDERFSTLKTAFDETDLLVSLDDEGPFTLFAPTDSALGESWSTAELLDLPKLEELLKYHVHGGQLSAAELERVTAITTIDGPEIHVRFTLDGLELNDGVTLGGESIEADNGIVHVIDRALIRPLVTETVDYKSTSPQLIPDIKDIIDTIIIDDPGYVHDLRITIDIEHSRASDLRIYLGHTAAGDPSETRKWIPLLGSTATEGHDFKTVFADSASFDIVADVAPGAGDVNAFPEAAYRPYTSLESLLGVPAGGEWELMIRDRGWRESGRLVSWTISMTSGPELPAPALVLDPRSVPSRVLARGYTETYRPRFWQVGGLSGATLLAGAAGEFVAEPNPLPAEADVGALLFDIPSDAERGPRSVQLSAANGEVSRIISFDSLVVEPEAAGIEMLAQIPPARLGAGAGMGSDIWGWTDPLTGAEIVLIGTSTGTAFVDVSDPRSPLVLGMLPTATEDSSWRDIKVYKDHAFIVSEAVEYGMQVFDLTRLRDVEAPQSLLADANNTDFGSAHNIVINETTGFAYVVGSRYSEDCQGGLLMFDISTPTEPALLGCFAGGTPVGQEPGPDYPTNVYIHDAQCVSYSGPDPDYKDRELCFTADELSLGIVDVSDKAAPVQVARVSHSDVGYIHQGWLTEDQRYFLLDDELDEYFSGGNTKTYIWDMLDLDAPVLIGVIENPSEAIGHNLYTRDGLAYQANYTSGLRIVDLSEVASGSGSEIAYYDTYPEDDFFLPGTGAAGQSRSLSRGAVIAAQSAARHPEAEGHGVATFGGAWGNYPYFKSGIIVVSDMERGLFILRQL